MANWLPLNKVPGSYNLLHWKKARRHCLALEVNALLDLMVMALSSLNKPGVRFNSKQWNHTLTLVPKSLHATRVEDYHSISCCTVFYEVISKIFARILT